MAAPTSSSPPHVVIFPFMAQGHTIPLLDISKTLSSRGLKVTIITTPSNAPFLHSKVSTHSSISISVIPFPNDVAELPPGCENTADLPSMDLFAPFISATKKMKPPFEALLREMVDSGWGPVCVISDFFLAWTLDTCRSFGIPRVVSHGMGVLPMFILKTAYMHVPCRTTSYPDSIVQLPNLRLPFTLNVSDFPGRHADPDDPLSLIISESEEADKNSWGVIVNSFQELEDEEYVTAFETLHKQAKAWCVGPVLLYDYIQEEGSGGSHEKNQSCPYIKWLDEQGGSGAVIYVAFGTQAGLSENQMDEIAYGLEMSGHPFIWAVGWRNWGPAEGWEGRVEGRGLVVRNWVDQRSILAHPKVGGFLSHCGWNSVLESLSMGVPLLAWPMGAEQPLNAKFVAMGLKAGLMVSQEKITTVDRHVICDGVKELMGGEKGRRARERARELGTMARHAVAKGGSSDKNFDRLIKCLINNKRDQNSSISITHTCERLMPFQNSLK